MAFPSHVWKQIKNLTKQDIIRALERDGWERDPSSKGAEIGFIKQGSPPKRVVIHYHPRQTMGPKLLTALLRDIGWSEDDLRRLRLIK